MNNPRFPKNDIRMEDILAFSHKPAPNTTETVYKQVFGAATSEDVWGADTYAAECSTPPMPPPTPPASQHSSHPGGQDEVQDLRYPMDFTCPSQAHSIVDHGRYAVEQEFEYSYCQSTSAEIDRMPSTERSSIPGAQVHHVSSAVTCRECQQTFLVAFELNTHKRRIHQHGAFIRFNDGLLVDVDRMNGSFHCPRCIYEDVDPENLHNHVAVKHLDTVKSPHCMRCSFGFTDQAVEQYHSRTVHTTRAKVYFGDGSCRIVERRQGRFPCPACIFETVDPEKLNWHTSLIHEPNLDVSSPRHDGKTSWGGSCPRPQYPGACCPNDAATQSRVERRMIQQSIPTLDSNPVSLCPTTPTVAPDFNEQELPPTPPTTPGSSYHIPEYNSYGIPVRGQSTPRATTVVLNGQRSQYVDCTGLREIDGVWDKDFWPSSGLLEDAENLIDFEGLLNLDMELLG